MSDKILISRKLFYELLQYHFFDRFDYEDSIRNNLKSKLDDIVKRENYTKFLNEKDPQKRDALLRQYLDSK